MNTFAEEIPRQYLTCSEVKMSECSQASHPGGSIVGSRSRELLFQFFSLFTPSDLPLKGTCKLNIINIKLNLHKIKLKLAPLFPW